MKTNIKTLLSKAEGYDDLQKAGDEIERCIRRFVERKLPRDSFEQIPPLYSDVMNAKRLMGEEIQEALAHLLGYAPEFQWWPALTAVDYVRANLSEAME